MNRLDFLKMHSLGNDFVVIDARRSCPALSDEEIRWLCDRHRGVGCDQVLVLRQPKDGSADIFLEIRGRRAEYLSVCANGTRCVASLLFNESGRTDGVVETDGGLIRAHRDASNGFVAIDLGKVAFDWRSIPLTCEADTLAVPLRADGLPLPVCTNVGNSHATFFVGNIDEVPLEQLGPTLESASIFGRKTNIGVAAVIGPDTLALKVWEPAAGVTLACGSGACAASVAAARLGLTGRHVTVQVAHGSLFVEWTQDNHVHLSGPVALSFAGAVEAAAGETFRFVRPLSGQMALPA